MLTPRRHLWVLIAAVSLSPVAGARSGPQCKDRCLEKHNECKQLCTEHAPPKAAAYCKKACADENKKCDDKCAKKSR